VAHQIPVGIGVATNVRVSNSIGAQLLPVARRAAALGFIIALVSTVLTALLLLAARRPWAQLFTDDDELVRRDEGVREQRHSARL
jgi:MATE family multidrug resistance protein